MAKNQITIQLTEGDTTTDVDIDLSLEAFTLRESVVLEDHLPDGVFRRLMDGEFKPAEMTPRVIQAVIYARLRTAGWDVPIDAFDFQWGTLADALGA